MDTEVLIRLAYEQTCPAGLPHTGDAPEEDHGHSSCWIIHRLIEKIQELDMESQKLAGVLMGPYVAVNESKVEEVDELLATRIGRVEIEGNHSLLPPDSHSFDALEWAGLI